MSCRPDRACGCYDGRKPCNFDSCSRSNDLLTYFARWVRLPGCGGLYDEDENFTYRSGKRRRDATHKQTAGTAHASSLVRDSTPTHPTDHPQRPLRKNENQSDARRLITRVILERDGQKIFPFR